MSAASPAEMAEIVARTHRDEIIIWVTFCSALTVLGWGFATYDYYKKIRNTPAAKRKRRALKEYTQQMDEERKLTSISVDPIVKVDFLSEWKQRQKKNTLVYEFKALDRRQGVQPRVAASATAPRNVAKNTGTILPYEHNIVKLQPTERFPAPYANASWIDGFQHPQKYIAAQGPNEEGIQEFFLMIWQKNVKCIVMLNQIFENGKEKGVRYWKDGSSPTLRFGSFVITTVDFTTTADFVLRHLKIEHEGQQRLINHFHLINWSDMDRTNIIGFLEIRRHLKNMELEHNQPIVIHCNNGSGRTGAFICADVNLDRVNVGRPIDIFGFSVHLRRSRQKMIHTQSQYQFVYELMANYITCGITVMPVENLAKTVQRLALKVDTKNTGFEKELKNINTFTLPLGIGDSAAGHRSENQWKSRDIMLQPPERSRPYLMANEHAGGTDYINAVYIDGYRCSNQYLVTQWPLKSTVNDVWRLVHDHRVSVIVVLNDMGKGSRSYPRFWPAVKNQSTGFGPVAVELLRDYELTPNVKCRIFKVRKIVTDLSPKVIDAMKKYGVGEEIIKLLASRREMEQPRIVVMLQTTCWPNRHRVPESTVGLLELIQASDEFFQELCMNKHSLTMSPILVMSKDGVSRAGCFCVVSISKHRMLIERNVDIFRATEIVKRNRPQLVDSISEFLLCYDSCLEFYNQNMRDNVHEHEDSAVSLRANARRQREDSMQGQRESTV